MSKSHSKQNNSESANDMPPTGAGSPEGKTITNRRSFINGRMTQLRHTYRKRKGEIGTREAMLELMRNIDDLNQEVAKLPPTVLPTNARPTLSSSFFEELYEDMEADLQAREEEDDHDD